MTEQNQQIQYQSDTANTYCRILLDILLAKGVKSIFLSPGSRNTPLLIGAGCRPFHRHVITDERTAAFAALGKSMASGEPVALICTSGTALYNYAPAVAEAFYQNIPLIVVSADRPAEWIGQDDSQTLIQPEALDKIVKGSFDIPVGGNNNEDDRNGEWYVNRTVNQACNLALRQRRGPVHINIHLDNPLSDTIPYKPSDRRLIEIEDNLNFPPHVFKRLAGELAHKKVLVTAGFMPPDNTLNRALADFCNLPNVALMCETLSNLHLQGNPYIVDSLLTLMENDGGQFDTSLLVPDIVISIGGALISRKLKEFIRKCKPAEHWTLGDTEPDADCFMSLTRHLEIAPSKFFKGVTKNIRKLKPGTEAIPAYSDIWKGLRDVAMASNERFMTENNNWAELRAFDILMKELPADYNLFLSNGTVVRYAQLFTERIPHASFGNRGVSGIEGTTATAYGTALAYQGPTLLISGDMSFAYDTGVLGLGDMPEGFKIIVINNSGGGIFRFIPSTRCCEQREELFCAPPSLPLSGIAEAYRWDFLKASSSDEFRRILPGFLHSSSNCILEICVDGNESADMLVNYMKRKI